MIKIKRIKKPKELTDEVKKKLTEEFKLNKTRVWGSSFIKKALLEMSHNKCCYCEVKLIEEGKYMHVEHFHHKDKYEDEVVEWNNLLPSCERCNKSKSSHDTKLYPIIDPTRDDPKESLMMKNYRFKGKNELGKLTIDVLNLNDTDKLVMARFNIGEEIQKKVESILVFAREYTPSDNIRRRNRIINGIKDLFKEGLPEAEFSATVSTVLLNDCNYIELKSILKSKNLWDDDMDNLEGQLQEAKLDENI